MVPASRWLAYLSASDIRNHETWVRRGYQGSGRIVLENLNLRRATLRAPTLVSARFVKCDLTEANVRIADLTGIELIACIWNDALLEMSRFDKAIIQDCQFVRACLEIAKFIGTHAQGGNWNKADLNRVTWQEAQVDTISFQEACFRGARLYNTKFSHCDFNRVDFKAADVHETIFYRCDFRNCDINYLKIKNTLFNKCGFYGCTGTPTIEGECQVIEPDFSENFDGSKAVDSEKL